MSSLLSILTNSLLSSSRNRSQQLGVIVDHGHQKNGQFSSTETTLSSNGRMDALANLVTSRPEKVASLLRTTWLSD